MSAPRKPHPVESLSFVTDRAPKSSTNVRRCFWNVQPTGDFVEDCKLGQRLAIEYLRYRRTDPHGHGVLGFMVRDMPPNHTGVEVAEMQLTHGSLVNQRPDGSVVIEQPDGTRAVYRKEGAA
jgi:hypothetical protein